MCVASACGGPCPDNAVCNTTDGFCYCSEGKDWDGDEDGDGWNCVRQGILSNSEPDELESFCILFSFFSFLFFFLGFFFGRRFFGPK